MPKRTKRQSLLRCRKIWQWLADHPEGPPDYAKIRAYEALGFARNDKYNCPVCAWKLWHIDDWPGFSDACNRDCLLDWGVSNCESTGAAYKKWTEAYNCDQRSQYAQQIVALCDKALAALPARRKTK